MKFNLSVFGFALVILASNLVFVISDSSIVSDDSTIPELTVPMVDKVRVNRRTHCGVRTFKLLMLICTNDFKFPVERQALKDINNNDQLLNYETSLYNKRSNIQTSLSSSDLLNDQATFNNQQPSFNDQATFNDQQPFKRLIDYNTLQDNIPDVHVHNNRNYHRIKRSLIRDCCYRACTLKELENLC